jgi:multimeric flavodoxin WrbA
MDIINWPPETNGDREMMKIVVINGTEQHGCTYAIKEIFLDAVGRGNNITELVLPADCPVFCTGCKACFYKDISVCPHAEYTVPIWEAISAADLLVFATPVYVFHATAQIKALLDHYGTKWMAHSPESQMFHKQAVILTCAAGAGMGGAVKDISDSLRYWGVSKIYAVKQALHETRWEQVSQNRKDNIARKCSAIVRRIKPTGKVTPGIGTRVRFSIMRMATKLINKSQIKAGQPETQDHKYWRENGWLNGARPWK